MVHPRQPPAGALSKFSVLCALATTLAWASRLPAEEQTPATEPAKPKAESTTPTSPSDADDVPSIFEPPRKAKAADTQEAKEAVEEEIKTRCEYRRDDMYVPRIYDLSDLFLATETAEAKEFAHDLTEIISPTNWTEVGGQGMIQVYQRRGVCLLIVAQTAAVHRQLVEFLAEIRKLHQKPVGDAKASRPKDETHPTAVLPKADAKPTAEAQDAHYAPKELSPGEKIETALDKLVTVVPNPKQPVNLIDWLRNTLKIKTAIDHKAFEEAKLDPAEPIIIECELRGLTAREVLEQICAEKNLAYWVLNDALQITSEAEFEKHLEVKVYPISDLYTPAEDLELPGLIEIITSTYAPTTWDDVGGQGKVNIYQRGDIRALTMYQTQDVQRQVRHLLSVLRMFHHLAPITVDDTVFLPTEAKPAQAPSSPPTPQQRIEAALESRMPFSLEGYYLHVDLINTIQTKLKIPVAIDKRSLEEGGVNLDSSIQIDFNTQGLKLRSFLDMFLREYDLVWVIRDETLLITTRTHADTIVTTTIYDVSDLFNPTEIAELEEFSELIQSVVLPNSWSDVGGQGALKIYRRGDSVALIVAQTQSGHEQIATLLHKLRTLPGNPQANTASSKPKNPQRASWIVPHNAKRNALVAANSKFAWQLLGEIRQQPGNLLISPYSISLGLGMAEAGSSGKTAEEMANVLHGRLTRYDVAEGYQQLQEILANLNASNLYSLHSANRVWLHPLIKPDLLFSSTLKEKYGAELGVINFSRAGADQIINAWIAEQTAGAIPKALSTPLPVDTAFTIVNAIEFRGRWERPFATAKTRHLPFDLGSQRVNVPFMQQTGTFNYAEIDKTQLLELDYAGRALSMVLLLPAAEPKALPELERSLAAGKLESWMQKLDRCEGTVLIPKFEFPWSSDLSLPLAKLGLARAFSKADAEFQHVGQSALSIHLSSVMHATKISVDEAGTKAAAATVVGGTFGGGGPPKFTAFWANRPFLFLIRDKRTGSILFLGRLAELSGTDFTGKMPTAETLVPS